MWIHGDLQKYWSMLSEKDKRKMKLERIEELANEALSLHIYEGVISWVDSSTYDVDNPPFRLRATTRENIDNDTKIIFFELIYDGTPTKICARIVMTSETWHCADEGLHQKITIPEVMLSLNQFIFHMGLDTLKQEAEKRKSMSELASNEKLHENKVVTVTGFPSPKGIDSAIEEVQRLSKEDPRTFTDSEEY